MVRNSVSPDLSIDTNTGSAAGTGGAFGSIRDRFHLKRSPKPNTSPNFNYISPSPSPRPTPRPSPRHSKSASATDRQYKPARSHHHRSLTRKILQFPFRDRSWLYLCIFFVIFVFAMASMMLQSSIMSVLRPGWSDRARWRWSVREDLRVGSSYQFVPQRRFDVRGGALDRLRNQPRIGVRPPGLGLILGNMKKNPSSLMLSTVTKCLQQLGYVIKIYAVEDGVARSMWEEIGGQVSILGDERYRYVDWSIFESIIVESLEAKDAVSSLMQEPFCSVPLIWIIEEDTLANRLQHYENIGSEHLISHWKNVFRRAEAIVFPDFSFPMLYSLLDSGNFFVIPGSPVDVWAAESYSKTHFKDLLRKENGFDEKEMLVLVIGSSFFYSKLSWNYAMVMDDIEPLLVKYAGVKDVQDNTFKFLFLCGNSSEEYDNNLQDVANRLGLQEGSLLHVALDGDVNRLMLMSDIVLYASSQNEQGFPSLLIRAMSFGLPTIAPDLHVIKNYVVDGVHGMIFRKHDPNALSKAFSLLISNRGLSKLAHSIASSGRSLAKNMLAAECISGYAKLLENVVNFPSDVLLPGPTSQIKQTSWEWNDFQEEVEQANNNAEDISLMNSSVVYDLEEDTRNLIPSKNMSVDDSEALVDFPTKLDWDILGEMERSEELEILEMEEFDQRMEQPIGDWDEIYRNARRSEKLKSEPNERDEGELERTGQPLCIYEIYNGAGAWPFLHHGSLYRGLSLSTSSQRLTSDDVDAVGRLPILNDTYYRDVLCEIGGMFAIANGIDNVHKRPWIGFQSWRASGRMVALSTKAEQVLEKTIQGNTKGDVIYFWARADIGVGLTGSTNALTFWSMCDLLNGGKCRTAFEDAFRQMYALPSHVEALPPMPEDGGHWSALHSWVMPTRSYLEFVMFSRIFADSLHSLHKSSSNTSHCPFGSSLPEKRQCYCRILELLVNVWAYHSARKMVYIDPHSGFSQEQHPVEQRKGLMWVKYLDATLVKSMDEDLAEAADDNDHPYEMWLWPLTGEVYWQGIYEREREERYRMKMDKKRKTKEKLLDRMKHGYKQKSLAG